MINRLKGDIRRIEYEISLMRLNPNENTNATKKEAELNNLVKKLSIHDVSSSNKTCFHEWNEHNRCVNCCKSKYY
jgi:hypothetical protein